MGDSASVMLRSVMRYAIVSDIHANLQAWNAVLSDLTALGAERIICLGDVVGYGPDPAAVLESMYRHVDAFVMGNHDAVLCGKLSPARFNDQARRMIEWTAARVSRRAADFLARQSLALTGPGFCCAHGDLAVPGAFRYLVEPGDAVASWNAVPDPLIFVGHTHVPGIFVLGPSGVPHPLPAQDFILEEGKRFLVNVGSVGFPRDRDARASYCLYDTDEGAVRWRRVPFDLDALGAALAREGLGADTLPMLARDPRTLRKPIREQLHFTPALDATQLVRDVVTSRDLTRLRRRARSWRALALGGAAAALLAAAAAGALFWRQRAHHVQVPAAPLPPHEIVIAQDLRGNLLPPVPESIFDGRLGAWRYRLADGRVQTIALRAAGEHAPAFVVTHRARAHCQLEAPTLLLSGLAAGKAQVQTMIRRGPDFDGRLEIIVGLVDRDAHDRRRARPNLLRCEPTLRRGGGWELAQRTTDAPLDARAEELQFRIEGEFTGSVEIAAPSLRLL